jgi:hypothetical protein
MSLGKLKGWGCLTFQLSPQLSLPPICWFLRWRRGSLAKKEDECCPNFTEKHQDETREPVTMPIVK